MTQILDNSHIDNLKFQAKTIDGRIAEVGLQDLILETIDTTTDTIVCRVSAGEPAVLQYSSIKIGNEWEMSEKHPDYIDGNIF